MTDKELEVQEEEILESQDAVDAEEQLDESPKAQKKESVKSTKKEEEDMEDESDEDEGDMEDSDEGDDDDEEEASESKKKSVKESAKPKTKAGMIQAMMDIVSSMKKDDIASNYDKVMAAFDGSDDEEEEAAESKKSVREVKKITKEDINVKEDVAAIFNGEDLSEDFTTKASTIFEAAVLSKVNEVLESVTVDFEAELEAEKSSIQEDLSKKLDDYLEYVAEEWMKETELAVEQGVRAE